MSSHPRPYAYPKPYAIKRRHIFPYGRFSGSKIKMKHKDTSCVPAAGEFIFKCAEAAIWLPPKGGVHLRKKKLETHISPRLDEISRARSRGATKKEIARMLGISLATLNRAEQEDKDLQLALRSAPGHELEREKIKEAFLKRACGYIAREEVHEMREKKLPDGRVERELVLTKLVSKEVPPDLSAAKWLLENEQKREEASQSGEEGLEEALKILKLRQKLLEQGEAEEE